MKSPLDLAGLCMKWFNNRSWIAKLHNLDRVSFVFHAACLLICIRMTVFAQPRHFIGFPIRLDSNLTCSGSASRGLGVSHPL